MRPWLEAPLASSAARNDLNFHRKALRYRMVEPRAAFIILQSVRRHQWYTTGQMVTMALCDTGLEREERESLAKKIHSTPRTKVMTGRPDFPVLDWRVEESSRPSLASLVTESSWLVFDKLGLEGRQVRWW